MRDNLSHHRPGLRRQLGSEPLCDTTIETRFEARTASLLRPRRYAFFALTAVGLATLAGCSSSSSNVPAQLQSDAAPPVVGGYSSPSRTGVEPSPLLVRSGRTIPRGGGVYKVGKPYRIAGTLYVPREDQSYNRSGKASWYGTDFHGRKTANGEIFDMHAMTAAHPTLPLPSYAFVTNTRNGRTVLVRINDRGPYAHNRIIDLSRAAARALDFEQNGVTDVHVRYAGRAPLNGDETREQRHLAQQSWHRGPRSQSLANRRRHHDYSGLGAR